ncbi:MAG: Wzz/FepE/Etk N-terminal domain-containing protein [Chloroflexota bacterium]
MELSDYIRILRKRGWIIIALLVMTAASAFVVSKLQTPIYKSSAEVLIQPARPDFGLAQSAKLLLRSYASWMSTETRAQEVIDQLSLDRVPGSLLSDVAIASDESRLVIKITVEDPDGNVANDIARVWIDQFVQWRNDENKLLRKEDQVDADPLDPPRYGLARPKWKVNVLAGAVMGALIGGVIVFILEWLESGVMRRSEDIDRHLSLPVLGAIPGSRMEVAGPQMQIPGSGRLLTPAIGVLKSRALEADTKDQAGPVDPVMLPPKGDE